MLERNYLGLASGILLRAQKDLEGFPKESGGKAYHDELLKYGQLLEDVEIFLGSGWCETLCQGVNIDHSIYVQDMSEILQRQRKRYDKEVQRMEEDEAS